MPVTVQLPTNTFPRRGETHRKLYLARRTVLKPRLHFLPPRAALGRQALSRSALFFFFLTHALMQSPTSPPFSKSKTTERPPTEASRRSGPSQWSAPLRSANGLPPNNAPFQFSRNPRAKGELDGVGFVEPGSSPTNDKLKRLGEPTTLRMASRRIRKRGRSLNPGVQFGILRSRQSRRPRNASAS